MKTLLHALLLAPLAGLQAADAPVKKPNVLVIFTDDLDFEEVNALADYGNAALAGKPPGKAGRPLTPQLDRLVGQGQAFTQFYVNATVCTPSRYALLTGQYASRSASLREKHPVTGAANVEFNTDILPGQWHLARALHAAGYTTGFVGKWHNTDVLGDEKFSNLVVTPPIADHRGKEYGPQDPSLPENARRVREAYQRATAFMRDEIGWDYVSSLYMNNANGLGLPKPLCELENNMEWFTAGALKFLEQQKDRDKPFFLYLAPNVPHGIRGESFARADPRATPEGLVDWHLGVQPSREDVLRRVHEAGANKNMAWATWLDDGLGVILQKLDDLGLSDDTIVVFSSDHQSRGKWTCYEAARVPLVVRWPGQVEAGGRNETLLSSVDIVPTLLELAGAPLPAADESVLDGRSFAGALTGGAVGERPVLVEMGYGRAIVSDGWKYIAVRFPEDVLAEAAKTGQRPTLLGAINDRKARNPTGWPSFGEADQLFDLRADPLEQKNLAGDPAHAAKLDAMQKLLRETVAPLPHVYAEFKTAP